MCLGIQSHLDNIPLDEELLQRVYKILCKHYDLPKITVKFSGRSTERRWAYAYNSGKHKNTIVLNNRGKNVGTFLHELAHLVSNHGHGDDFYYWNEQLINIIMPAVSQSMIDQMAARGK